MELILFHGGLCGVHCYPVVSTLFINNICYCLLLDMIPKVEQCKCPTLGIQ